MVDVAMESVPVSHFYCPSHFSPSSTSSVYQSPRCELIEINDVVVMARTDFLFKDKQLIYPDGFIPEDHISTLEQFNLGVYHPGDKSFVVTAGLPTRSIKKAVNLLAGGAGNYAHFISELVPRLLALDKYDSYLDYPLLVDGWMGVHLQKIFVYFNKNCREIICLDSFESVHVENLIHVSPAVFAPQDFRANFEDGPDGERALHDEAGGYRFSTQALEMVRTYAWEKSDQYYNRYRNMTRGTRVYLQRKPNFLDGIQYNKREIVNEHEVEEILRSFGFISVDTTTMSFEEQVSVLKNAEAIAAPLGASLINATFSNPGAVVLGLGAYYENSDYSYHAKMMAALKHNYYPVLGSQLRKLNQHPMHNSYFICTASLQRALETTLGRHE